MYVFIDKLVLDLVTVRLGRGYLYLSWIIKNNKKSCKLADYVITLLLPNSDDVVTTQDTFYNFTYLFGDTLYNITVYGHNRGIIHVPGAEDAVTTVAFTSVRTVTIRGTYLHMYNICLQYIHICMYICMYANMRSKFKILIKC